VQNGFLSKSLKHATVDFSNVKETATALKIV